MPPHSTLLARLARPLAPFGIAAAVHSVVVSVPSDVLAQASRSGSSASGANLIAAGRSMFEDQRYEESIQTLSAALLRPGTSKKDRIEIYRLLAYNYIVLSQKDEAEAAVRGLYAVDPGFRLAAGESPRFRDFFADVKKRWEAEGRPGLVTEQETGPKPVAIKHASPAERERDKEIPITGELEDPGSRVDKVWLHYRAGSIGKFHKLDARLSAAKFRGVVPASAVKPPLIEYYLTAADAAGLPIATRGDAAAPLRIAIPAPQEESGGVFSSPWFWTGAGAVVVGGVLAAILLTRKSEPAPSEPIGGGGAGGSGGGGGAPTSRVVIIVGQ
jgi:hypothetical protein